MMWRTGKQCFSRLAVFTERSWTNKSLIRHQRQFGAVTTMKVPGMGDSITEGLLSEMVKHVGDVVNVDDVLAIIETDKVAVDIRSEYSGKIVAVHCEEGDDVEVGAKLLDIEEGEGRIESDGDTSEEVSSSGAEESQDVIEAVEVPPTAASGTTFANRFEAMRHNHHRTPLIKFTHGKGKVESTTSASIEANKISAETRVTVDEVVPRGPIPLGSPLYGRPLMTNAEIDAINMGGSSPYE